MRHAPSLAVVKKRASPTSVPTRSVRGNERKSWATAVDDADDDGEVDADSDEDGKFDGEVDAASDDDGKFDGEVDADRDDDGRFDGEVDTELEYDFGDGVTDGVTLSPVVGDAEFEGVTDDDGDGEKSPKQLDGIEDTLLNELTQPVGKFVLRIKLMSEILERFGLAADVKRPEGSIMRGFAESVSSFRFGRFAKREAGRPQPTNWLVWRNTFSSAILLANSPAGRY